MTFNQPKDEDTAISLEGMRLNQVTEFQYLGSRMSSSQAHFKRKRGLARAAFWEMEKIWRARDVPIKLKLSLIFKTLAVSVFLYGCETWIVNAEMAQKIDLFATRCYRIMLGIKRLDRVTNEAVYKRVDQQPLLITVQQRHLRRTEHALQRDSEEPTSIFALYEPTQSHGKTKRGATATTHRQYISSLLSDSPRDLIKAKIAEMASDRKEWKDWSSCRNFCLKTCNSF